MAERWIEMDDKGKRYKVVAVTGRCGGVYEVGYWTLPEVKSGWMPLAEVYGNIPTAPAVVAVIQALQGVVDLEQKLASIITVRLNKHGNSALVLGKNSKDGHRPYAAVFVNFVQANRAAAGVREKGIACEVIGYGQPAKYVKILEG